MLLDMTAISKAFGANRVLNNVDFAIDRGEIVALLGANGAGKSTLMKIMTGLYRKDGGMIAIEGAPVEMDSPATAMRHGIRLVPQELSVLPDLSVAENIFLGTLPATGPGPLGRVKRDELNRRAAEILAQLGVDTIDVRSRLGRYSVSEQRLMEIARALAGDARLLVMDEPTASLSAPECRRLFDIMRRLKTRGVSIIFISHFLDEVFEICDRIVVLRDGQNAGAFPTAQTTHDAVLGAMLGRQMTDLYPAAAAQPGAVRFSAEHLRALPNVQDVGFSVRRGEIHGVFGLVGSGVEDLGKVLFGARRKSGGALALDGSPFEPANSSQAVACGVGFVSGERKSEGIVPEMTVRDNITFPFLRRHQSGLAMSTGSQREFAQRWIEGLGIRTSGTEQKIGGLSGGNQQKVCIGRWLVDEIKVLILEEPTRGVDLGARKDIYAHLRALSDRGLAVILISSDPEEVGGIADSSTVLVGGRTAARFDHQVDAQTLMQIATRDVAA
ncbi:MAG: hypothetical protein ABS76_17015 [Pelagibacterium sp. SCN 64-44]|nr:MAG: hypothetical protein ABS76_17015 [Pelagibacterium sp. SCN 64-44]